MPKYLYQATFTERGAQGVLREGGTSRRETIAELAASHGGTLEAFYFAFGPVDVFVILDLPDHEVAAAVALAISASGAVAVETTVLLTVEDLDGASAIDVDYRPPGG